MVARFFRRPDGTYYETAIFVVEGPWEYSSAYLNDADGNQTRCAASRRRSTTTPAPGS